MFQPVFWRARSSFFLFSFFFIYSGRCRNAQYSNESYRFTLLATQKSRKSLPILLCGDFQFFFFSFSHPIAWNSWFGRVILRSQLMLVVILLPPLMIVCAYHLLHVASISIWHFVPVYVCQSRHQTEYPKSIWLNVNCVAQLASIRWKVQCHLRVCTVHWSIEEEEKWCYVINGWMRQVVINGEAMNELVWSCISWR